MAFAVVLASRLRSFSPSPHNLSVDSRVESASIASSQDTCASSLGSSSLSPSLDSRSCVSEPGSLPSTYESNRMRRNEHLAVLLPKRLWKPDAQASYCDIFLCHKKFSIWERRHHCRKCGGVFCAQCTMHMTALLDTSNLEFFHPPRDVPIAAFDSPTSPVVPSRVCDDCWDQIHGARTPRFPMIKLSAPVAVLKDLKESDSSSSSVASSLSTPSDGSAFIRRSIRRVQTSPRIPASPLRSPIPMPQSVTGVHVADSEPSFGELESYPLARASTICKASGGGRWKPEPCKNFVGYRIPGSKAAYEIELEREEEEYRRRRTNPIIRDGDIQTRAPRELEPRSPAGPIRFSTF
ncbi:hypothetical protein AcV5_004035 [Taiwanofungus camphoratus]|nr:hypothetical protein AcW2_001368 [Antrodia cinnamomea]KAI0935686.1 hypothetical protein AcV5_004035 [Antrodia cinnamomea]